MRFRVLLGLLLFCAAGIWTMADETEAASGEAWNEDGSVTITTETFPDDWFRETVAQKFDVNCDCKLSREEIAAATKLVITDKIKFVEKADHSGVEFVNRKVGDFRGIEYLTDLEEFEFRLDDQTEGYFMNPEWKMKHEGSTWISEYRRYEQDMRAFLKEQGLKFVEEMQIDRTNCAKYLDLSKNSKLRIVQIYRDTQMKYLDLHGLQKLETVFVSGSHDKLERLDVSGAENLSVLRVTMMQLKTLNLSGANQIKLLDIKSGKLQKLDLSHCVKLENLLLKCRMLKHLNVSRNKRLKTLYLFAANIKKLNINQNERLEELFARRVGLTSITMNRLKKLRYISLGGNKLKKLYINGDGKQRIRLYCDGNNLKKLVFGKKARFESIDCRGNSLKTIRLYQDPKTMKDLLTVSKVKVVVV